jgi:hypothetical protein
MWQAQADRADISRKLATPDHLGGRVWSGDVWCA